MLFAEELFYRNFLDLQIPQMKEASDRYARGDEDGAAKVFADYVKQILRPELFFSTLFNRERLSSDGTCPARVIEEADRACTHTLISVGFPYTFEAGKIDWEINPTFNAYAEWTWQLSRHHEFFALATAYRATRDEKYARMFAEMILSWTRQAICPENLRGNATKCWRTIEAGIRMYGSWPYAIHAFLNSPTISDRDWVTIFRSVYEHAYRLRNFCTSHNWLIMELNGLLGIGVLYPFFQDAGEWSRYALDRLVEELKNQLYPDDFQYELTTNYHGVNLFNYYCAAELLRVYGREVPKEFSASLYAMYRLYVKLVCPSRRLPDLNDGSRRDIRREMQNALQLFPTDPVFRYFATDGKEGAAPPFTSVFLPYSGFVVMRTGWGREDIWALFDGGPFGKAHQHEDKLNVLLSAYGADMLADTGSYAYDSSDMRKYALASRSHNTGLVDGFGQNRRSRYKWDPSDIEKRAEELTYQAEGEVEIASSFYEEGYGPDAIPVRHARKLVFFRQGFAVAKPFFIVLDCFEAQDDAEHCFEVSFQLGVEPICARDRRLTVRHPNGATFAMIGDICPKILIGQYAPEFVGWRPIPSPVEHEHAPAPVVAYTKRGKRADFATILYPAPDENIPEITVSLREGKAEITIEEQTKSVDF